MITSEELKNHIDDLRFQGLSFQEIGDRVNLSRERVRQINGAKSLHSYGLWFGNDVIRRCGIDHKHLKNAINLLGIVPYRETKAKILFNMADYIMLVNHFSVSKTCRMCGSPLPPKKWIYCSRECAIEGNKYKHRSPDQRKKHSEYVKNWQRQNPEKAKEINDRSNDKRRAKKQGQSVKDIIK